MFELEGKEKVKFFDIVVGHVTTPAYSRRLGKSLALVHLVPSAAVEGTALELKKDRPYNAAPRRPAFPSSTHSASDCTPCNTLKSPDGPFYNFYLETIQNQKSRRPDSTTHSLRCAQNGLRSYDINLLIFL
jgi:hypothetical protein